MSDEEYERPILYLPHAVFLEMAERSSQPEGQAWVGFYVCVVRE